MSKEDIKFIDFVKHLKIDGKPFKPNKVQKELMKRLESEEYRTIMVPTRSCYRAYYRGLMMLQDQKMI